MYICTYSSSKTDSKDGSRLKEMKKILQNLKKNVDMSTYNDFYVMKTVTKMRDDIEEILTGIKKVSKKNAWWKTFLVKALKIAIFVSKLSTGS